MGLVHEMGLRMTFANWLKDQMQAAKMSQTALADELDTQQSAISAWLLGKGYPGNKNLTKLAELFHVDKIFLLRLIGRIDGDHEFSPEVAARFQQVEKYLAEIDDPRILEIILADIDNGLRNSIDLAERLQDLKDDISKE